MNHESSNRMTIEGVIEIAICEWRLERVEVERNENIRSLNQEEYQMQRCWNGKHTCLLRETARSIWGG